MRTVCEEQTLAFLGDLSRRARARAASAPDGRSVQFTRRGRGDELTAAYDAARTTEQNKGYWAHADLLSADAANSPDVRRTLRSRSRYECLEANPFANGIVKSLANEQIGRGPTLQLLLRNPDKSENHDANDAIEHLWETWARRIKLGRKLRTARKAKFVDGEVFLRLVTNRRLRGPIKLDIEVVECDRVSSHSGAALGSDLIDWAARHGIDPLKLTDLDGVIFEQGNVVAYRVYKHHPGGNDPRAFLAASEIVPAEQMIHMFRQDRPGQHRGIPESTTALPLFILLRDYTLAVVQNARSVAKHTVLMKTQSGALFEDGESSYPIDPFEAVEIDYDMSTYVPRGWEPVQLRADQPATTFEMFRNAIWNEVARCADMPYNVAAANSSKSNYASGRLDYQLWDSAIDVEHSEWDDMCLDAVLEAFFDEAVLAGMIPSGVGSHDEIPHEWYWPGRGHVDPAKEANGQKTRLSSGTTSLRRELKKEGIDHRAHVREAAEDLGMSEKEYRRSIARGLFNLQQPGDAAGNEDEDEDEATAQSGASGTA